MDGFSQILSNIADNTEPNASKGDYIKDGLLYCGKCNTPKQVITRLCGIEKKPYCMCKCEAERDKQERQRIKNIFAQEAIERTRSNLDIRSSNQTFANSDGRCSKLFAVGEKYVENFAKMRKLGKGFIIFGDNGTGKSYLAACITNALISKGYSCLMTSFPQINTLLSGTYEGKQAFFDSLNQYDLLVIDDLGAERETEYSAENIFNVIDSRYRVNLPLIITTNITQQEYYNPQNSNKKRIYSRLHQMCFPMLMLGEDSRKTHSAYKDAELRELLGV